MCVFKKNPYITSQSHTDQTNNKLYLYEKTNTTSSIISGISDIEFLIHLLYNNTWISLVQK